MDPDEENNHRPASPSENSSRRQDEQPRDGSGGGSGSGTRPPRDMWDGWNNGAIRSIRRPPFRPPRHSHYRPHAPGGKAPAGPADRFSGSGSDGAGFSWFGSAPAWNRYRTTSRVEVEALKAELKEAVESFKEAAKIYNANSVEMKIAHENVKKLVEDCASLIKAGLEVETVSLNMTSNQSAELKALVDELVEAVKSLKAIRGFKVSKMQRIYEGSRLVQELGRDVVFLTVLVGGLLVAFGYIFLEEPAPFNPRETKAGRLLNDDFVLGARISCKSSIGQSDTITSMLCGELDSLQSDVLLQRIADTWSSQLDISAGHDIVLKGGVKVFWVKGLTAEIHLPLVDGANRTLELKHKHPFGTLSGKMHINATPMLSLNAMFGNKQLSAGSLIEFDRVLRRITVGGGFSMFGLSLSGVMSKILPAAGQPQPPRHEISASLHLEASASTSLAAQVVHDLDANLTSFTVGTQHQIDSSMVVKLKVTSGGVLTGLLQHRFGDKSALSVCTSVGRDGQPRFGLSVLVAP